MRHAGPDLPSMPFLAQPWGAAPELTTDPKSALIVRPGSGIIPAVQGFSGRIRRRVPALLREGPGTETRGGEVVRVFTGGLAVSAVLLAGGLMMTACEGGGDSSTGGGETTADGTTAAGNSLFSVSGSWTLSTYPKPEPGVVSGAVPQNMNLTQNGTSITGTTVSRFGGPVSDITGTVNGNSINMTTVSREPGSNYRRTLAGTLTQDATAGDQMAGTWSDSTGDTGTWDAGGHNL